MPQESTRQNMFILPQPRHITRRMGVCYVSSRTSIDVQVNDERIAEHVTAWLCKLSTYSQVSNSDPVCMVIKTASGLASQGYTLSIMPKRILLEGGSAIGCFYGLQTLKQLSLTSKIGLPCCVIEDEPDFTTRGVLHDVTRGKVPTLETLLLLVDRLAQLKINQLQLYIEHAFAFSFDPSICRADEGLTPEDVHTLDQYCHERFIDLVPAVANLGHMGRILSLPQYHQLAEIEADSDWEQMTWPQRARGLTLDVDNPASLDLVKNMWRDILAAFSSPVVNICGDEPWDLGRGKHRETLTEQMRMDIYIRHVCNIAKLCESQERHVQLWSDVLRHYPSACSQLPENISILHWGYDDSADYEATSRFVDHGYSTMVCPGTSGWKRIINAMDLAERNIKTFAQVGVQAGADGLITTDWGDHGHFNLLACSWHGITLGASLAWHVDHVIGETFDENFTQTISDDDGRALLSALRRTSSLAGDYETWRLLWQPAKMLEAQASLPSEDELIACIQNSQRATQLADKLSPTIHCTVADLRELAVSCRVNKLAARRLQWEVRRRLGKSAPANHERILWVDELKRCLHEYEACWRERNKESGLADIRVALVRVAKEVRDC